MKIAEFKELIARLEQLHAASGAATQAKDLRSFLKIFEGSEDKTVDEFVAETAAALSAVTATAASSTTADRIAVYADRLLQAGTNETVFRRALQSLQNDEKLKNSEWYAIANRYRNAPTGSQHAYRYSSVKAAKAAIEDTFIERFERADKDGIIDRLTRWAIKKPPSAA